MLGHKESLKNFQRIEIIQCPPTTMNLSKKLKSKRQLENLQMWKLNALRNHVLKKITQWKSESILNRIIAH